MHLSSGNPVSRFAFQSCNLRRYSEVKRHELVWNYQTTGEPLEMKENHAILREPEGQGWPPLFTHVILYGEHTVRLM